MKKEFYKSKTLWGLVVAMLGYFSGYEEAIVLGLGFAGYGFRDAMK